MTEVTMGMEKLGWCHPSTNLETAHPRELVVNSLPSQDAMSHEANSTSSYPSTPSVNFLSPPEEEFAIRASVTPCFMQAKPGPQPHLICIACNAMTRLWSVECPVSPPRTESARSWRGRSLTIWRRSCAPVDSDGMAMSNVVMVGWRMSRNSIPCEVVAAVALKTWSEVIRLDCPAQDWLTPTLKPDGKLGVVHVILPYDCTHPSIRD